MLSASTEIRAYRSVDEEPGKKQNAATSKGEFNFFLADPSSKDRDVIRVRARADQGLACISIQPAHKDGWSKSVIPIQPPSNLLLFEEVWTCGSYINVCDA
ncbi:hypothetical protein I7I51_03172 [Histoplasma capsulatum]|uniref:Uncharacterized protein n=1 Tax=Ajellomyces capsulatus TaxID=5037 RepID=A0A8A1MP11_AJECA|nr:hypothetical protein I7I51_03172 [Histoplasma capsulatum]